MNDQVAVPEKTKIRPNVETMVKTKSGSFHRDDFIGNTLTGLTVEQVKEIAAECGIDANKYDHLNVGQQRMNLGNRLRALTSHKEGAKDEESAAVDKMRDLVDSMATAFAEANEAKAAAVAAEKAAAKEAKAAEKAAKEAAKPKAKPEVLEGEGDTPD